MRYLTVLLLALLFSCFAAQAADDAKTLARGRELSTLFMAGETEAVFGQMTPGMQKMVRGPDGLEKFRKGVRGQLGEEVAVIAETVRHDVGFDVYLRTSRWSKLPDRVLMEWAVDADNHVDGFSVQTEPKVTTPAPT